MTKYVLTLIVVAVAGTWLLTRTTTRRQRADFVFVNRSGVFTLDPAAMSWMQDIRLALTVWEGLTSYHPQTTEPVPGSAFWPHISDDQRTYTFTIRPHARWSNGQPVTAHDFVYAWRRAIEPGTAADYAFFFEHIAGVKQYVTWRHRQTEQIAQLPAQQRPAAVRRHLAQADRRFADTVAITALDHKTLRIRLHRPVAYFLDICAFSVCLPVYAPSLEPFKIVGETGLIYYDEQWAKPHNTVYNGPFMIEQWLFKRSMHLRKNPHYWDRNAVKLETIEIIDAEDPNTAWLMYESAQVDWLTDIGTDFAPDLIAIARSPLPHALNSNTPNWRRNDIHAFPAFGTYYYDFNCTDRLPDGKPNPLRDPRLRKALTMAVDKRQLVDQVVRMGNQPATGFIPPGSLPDYAPVTGLPYDVPAARKLLSDAGYPQGRGLPEMSILYNTEAPQHARIAQAIAGMWQQHLGLQTRFEPREGKVFREDKRNTRFMICRAGWYGDYGDPTTFLDMFRTGNGNNDTGLADPHYDRLLDQAEQQPTAQRRLAKLADAERYLVNQAVPLLPLYHYVNVFAFDPDRLTNLYLTPRMMTMLKYVELKP